MSFTIPQYILILFLSLCVCIESAYVPELRAGVSTKFVNKQILKFGPVIQKQLDTANITVPPFDDKFQGVHVQFNLTNITQKFGIDWSHNASIINVIDSHTFELLMKNINITMKAHIQFKIGLGLKQKGTLDIDITKLDADITLKFTQPNCTPTRNSTMGFDVQIMKVYINPEKLNIKIEGKTIDNLIIRAVQSVLRSRLPGIIQKIAIQKGNPAISQKTCSPLQQVVGLADQSYVIIINATEVPYFQNKDILFAPLDITFINAVTNATNDQIQNDNLPENDLFAGNSQLSLIISSNMMNSILWLIDDSKVLSINVTNSMLGPDPPIELNTLNLSILIPSLMKWPKREVILLIEPSNRFSHLYVRDGKILAAMSLSIKFVVNLTGQGQPIKQCINKKQCIVACDLNTTISFSAAVYISGNNTLKGLLHTVAVQQLKTISAQVEVKTQQLKKILNTMIGSFRPKINSIIQLGIPIDLSVVQKYDVTGVLMKTKKDYAAVGLVFKK